MSLKFQFDVFYSQTAVLTQVAQKRVINNHLFGIDIREESCSCLFWCTCVTIAHVTFFLVFREIKYYLLIALFQSNIVMGGAHYGSAFKRSVTCDDAFICVSQWAEITLSTGSEISLPWLAWVFEAWYCVILTHAQVGVSANFARVGGGG